jgi:AcrR family transcriptional regulator
MKARSPPRPVGRPRSTSASAHEAILTAVQELLQEKSVRELTIEGVAARAGVGKPTIYRWWPTKPALVLAMFQERVVPHLEARRATTLEESIRIKVDALIDQFNGFFGKVMGELIAESQSNPELLRELHEGYILPRRANTVADIRKAQADGSFPARVDPELVVDAIFGSIYYQMLMKIRPLTHEYGQALVDQVFCSITGQRPAPRASGRRRRS